MDDTTSEYTIDLLKLSKLNPNELNLLMEQINRVKLLNKSSLSSMSEKMQNVRVGQRLEARSTLARMVRNLNLA